MSNLIDLLAQIVRLTEVQTATVGQTIFTLSSITYITNLPGHLTVRINGKTQPETAYTKTSSTQVTLSEALEGGETVEFEIHSYSLDN